MSLWLLAGSLLLLGGSAGAQIPKLEVREFDDDIAIDTATPVYEIQLRSGEPTYRFIEYRDGVQSEVIQFDASCIGNGQAVPFEIVFEKRTTDEGKPKPNQLLVRICDQSDPNKIRFKFKPALGLFNTIFLRSASPQPATVASIFDIVATISGIFPAAVPDVIANDEDMLSIVKLSKFSTEARHVITGMLSIGYEIPSDSPEIRIVFAVADPKDPDSDGFPNNVDTCPDIPNPEQINPAIDDPDGDGFGEVCDNCPSTCTPRPGFTCTNPEQADLNGDGFADDDADRDGVGEVCDNCPSTCNPRANFTCANPAQEDGDVDAMGNPMPDGFGDFCDNCPRNFNPSQLDSDVDEEGNPIPGSAGRVGVGDACETFFQNLAARPVDPGGVIILGSGTVFDYEFSCGGINASAVNVGVDVPQGVGTVELQGCSIPVVNDSQNRRNCFPGTFDPAFIDNDNSYTLGPNIPGVDPNLFVIHIQGVRDETPAFPLPVLCLANEAAVPIGGIEFDPLPAGATPVITSTGLDVLGLDPVVDADGAPVPLSRGETATTPANSLATVRVTPNVDDVLGLEGRFQLTIETALYINSMAIGVKSTGIGLDPANTMTIGGCDGTPQFVDIGGDSDVQVIPCPTAPPTNPDLGPGVATSTSFPGSYFVPPNDPGMLEAGAPPDTGYFVMEGALPSPFTSGGFPPVPIPSINYPDVRYKLGVVDIDLASGLPPALPQVFFTGTEFLPGVGAGNEIVPADSTQMIAGSDVTLEGGFEGEDNLDGDDFGDDLDLCATIPSSNLDRGSINTTDPDRVGDECQCGDGTVIAAESNPEVTEEMEQEFGPFGDGVVASDDVAGCQEVEASGLGGTAAAERCSVVVTPGEPVTARDLAVLQGQVQQPGSGTEIDNEACQPAPGS